MIYHTSHHLRVIRRSADTRGEGTCGLQCFKQHFPYFTPTGSDKTYHQWLFTMKVSSLQLDSIMLSYFITLFPLGRTTRYHHDIIVFNSTRSNIIRVQIISVIESLHSKVSPQAAQLQNRIIVITGKKRCWLVVYIFFSLWCISIEATVVFLSFVKETPCLF